MPRKIYILISQKYYFENTKTSELKKRVHHTLKGIGI